MSVASVVNHLNNLNLSVRPLLNRLEALAPMPALFLVLRVYVAWQFIKGGLTKISDVDFIWGFIPSFEVSNSTYFLFEEEYKVPFFSPEFAAELATYVELTLPFFLIAGLLGRVNAVVLFGFNLMAVISYWAMPVYGKLDHLFWGLIFLTIIAYGPGKWSLDHLVSRWLSRGQSRP